MCQSCWNEVHPSVQTRYDADEKAEIQRVMHALKEDPRATLNEYCHEGLDFDDVRSGMFSESYTETFPIGKPVCAGICSEQAFGASEDDAARALADEVLKRIRDGSLGCAC